MPVSAEHASAIAGTAHHARSAKHQADHATGAEIQTDAHHGQSANSSHQGPVVVSPRPALKCSLNALATVDQSSPAHRSPHEHASMYGYESAPVGRPAPART